MNIKIFDKILASSMTYENYKKLVLFVNACVGEGLSVYEKDAGDLLYFDVLNKLNNHEEDFWLKLDRETDKFIGRK